MCRHITATHHITATLCITATQRITATRSLCQFYTEELLWKKATDFTMWGFSKGLKPSKHAFTLDSVYFLLGIFTRAGDFCLPI